MTPTRIGWAAAAALVAYATIAERKNISRYRSGFCLCSLLYCTKQLSGCVTGWPLQQQVYFNMVLLMWAHWL